MTTGQVTNPQAKPQSPYARMFALPGAKGFCFSAAIARLPMSMMSLGIVLALNYMYNNWTIAGAMSAAYVLAVAAVTPLYARLFDRYGQKRVGGWVLAIQVVVMLAFALAALFRVPIGVLFVLAIVVGATQFSFGALVRTRWSYLLQRTGNEDLMNTAYAFEAAIDEVVYILGPILAATLATSFHPVSQLFVPVIAVAIGGTIFFSQKRTEPSVLRPIETVAVQSDDVELQLARGDYDAEGTKDRLRELGLEDNEVYPRPGRRKAAAKKNQLVTPTNYSQQLPERQVRNVLLYAGILPLMLTFLIFNMSFSAFDVSLTAAMEERGLAQFLGVQLAMLALGSFMGAMVFGSREHRGSHWRRMVICLVLLAIGFMLMRLTMDNLIVLGIVEVLGGVVVAPLLATGNLIVRDTVPEGSLTEGLSWLSTANAVGTSLGSLIGGVIIDHIDSHAGVTMTWIVVAASIPFALIGWFIVSQKNRDLNV